MRKAHKIEFKLPERIEFLNILREHGRVYACDHTYRIASGHVQKGFNEKNSREIADGIYIFLIICDVAPKKWTHS